MTFTGSMRGESDRAEEAAYIQTTIITHDILLVCITECGPSSVKYRVDQPCAATPRQKNLSCNNK